MAELRWRDYLFETEDSVFALLRDAIGERTAFVTGSGFDPRATHGLERLGAEALIDGSRVLTVELAPQSRSTALDDLAEFNRRTLKTLTTRHRLNEIPVPYSASGEPRWAGVQAAKDMVRAIGAEVDTVIVDISALPSSIFFPVIAGWIKEDERRWQRGSFLNLVVLVAENAAFDQHIREEGAGEPGPIGGFSERLLGTTSTEVKIWAPILGEGQSEQLERVHQYLQPAEVCPILPFPSRNPRRGDDLIIEYEKLLFDKADVDVSNFIYASEVHPFDVYRALVRLDERLSKALQPLGGAVVVPSVHSSKTLSLGVLLAAVERNLPVVTCPPSSYSIDKSYDVSKAAAESRLACAWLTGKPFGAGATE